VYRDNIVSRDTLNSKLIRRADGRIVAIQII